MTAIQRDHGGGLDAAIERYGGDRLSWIDLSTGINPNPYPIPEISPGAWTALPDRSAISALEEAAARFWQVPPHLEVVAAGGASALIAAFPRVFRGKTVNIPKPTYNEHLAAFEANGWTQSASNADVMVIVNPNNPTGGTWRVEEISAPQAVIDESFCDVCPNNSLLNSASSKSGSSGYVILKSFGKFWGLAGLRLGFAICTPPTAARVRDQLGPWAVSGISCEVGVAALSDLNWAAQTRTSLSRSAARLDALLTGAGFSVVGGTTLFRLAEVGDASRYFDQFARANILTRIFPYSQSWLRFGIPGNSEDWRRVENALAGAA